MSGTVDPNRILALQRQRIGDALYDVDLLTVMLEDARAELKATTAERDQLAADLEQLRTATDAG